MTAANSAAPGDGVEVSIVIVNWRSVDYLRKCLDSVRANSIGVAYEIVVIDSASFDGCDRMLAERFPEVRFIQSTENLGFARANNAAFRQATGRYVLFLNPDTEVVGLAIATMLDRIRQLPTLGIVGCRLLNTDGTVQTSCIQSYPTILNQVLDCDALRRLLPRSSLWGMAPLFEAAGAPVPVEAISGACMLVHRDTFARLGQFSTDYFMYSEDIDLCRKARDAGLTNVYIPDAIVIHHGGGSSSRQTVSAFAARMTIEARWVYFRKFRSRIYAGLYRMSIGLVSGLRVLAAGLVACATRGERRVRSRAAAAKWWAILGWALRRSPTGAT